jgi:hypothetical protein
MPEIGYKLCSNSALERFPIWRASWLKLAQNILRRGRPEASGRLT